MSRSATVVCASANVMFFNESAFTDLKSFLSLGVRSGMDRNSSRSFLSLDEKQHGLNQMTSDFSSSLADEV